MRDKNLNYIALKNNLLLQCVTKCKLTGYWFILIFNFSSTVVDKDKHKTHEISRFRPTSFKFFAENFIQH